MRQRHRIPIEDVEREMLVMAEWADADLRKRARSGKPPASTAAVLILDIRKDRMRAAAPELYQSCHYMVNILRELADAHGGLIAQHWDVVNEALALLKKIDSLSPSQPLTPREGT